MEFIEKICDAATEAKDFAINFFEEDTTTSRKRLLTIITFCLMTGILMGFVCSPIKKGIYINISNNGNNEDNKTTSENKKCKKGKK